MKNRNNFRHIHQSDLEEHADIGGETCYTVDDRGTRKFLFKKRSTSSTCAVCTPCQMDYTIVIDSSF